ncbi:MAG: glycosyltransferase family 4 protein [Bacteroidaceae bacterium]|nr:glycosyltransferase family 4 protein [Bacteroidaceae bacterium]
MKVVIVNTSEKVGGAAIAANRLMEALKKNGVSAKMIVRDRQTDKISVVAVKQQNWHLALNFLWERGVIFLSNWLSRKNLFQIDIANTGTDITSMPEFQQADVVHLHWVNQGFLSLDNIDKILHSGKKIVVTMHDQWYFTGICHYSGDCLHYREHCHSCPLIHGRRKKDISWKVFNRKRRMYADADITFVGCSQWIADLARSASLLKDKKIVSIPNAINMDVFHPQDKTLARQNLGLPNDKRLLLFGSQRITDERKGFKFLVEACEHIQHNNPEWTDKIGIVVVGAKSATIESSLPFPVYAVDYVSDEKSMVEIYNAVDLYVTPSLQDNLPNTIVESMACGVPCVGFRVGGIPEMIDHEKNGYVARYKDAHDFANGILWALGEHYDNLCKQAYQKAVATYSEKSVAEQYKKIYE